MSNIYVFKIWHIDIFLVRFLLLEKEVYRKKMYQMKMCQLSASQRPGFMPEVHKWEFLLGFIDFT